MKQQLIDYDLEWLDEEWLPEKVTHHTNKGELTHNEFDEMQAQSYGYKSVEELDRHNYSRDKQKYLTYGDKSQ